MFKIHIKRLLIGSLLTIGIATTGFAQSSGSRPDACESTASSAKTNSLILEIEARAYARAEALRAKLFDLQMQEFALQARLDDLDYWMTPEGIYRALAFVGSPRPMDEFRVDLRTRLENEKARVNKQLDLLSASRERLNAAIQETEAELQRVRQRYSTVNE